MTLSNNQLVDTLGLGAFWSEASSEINARIQSAISAFNGGGEFLTLSDVQDLGYISSGALSGYVQSATLANYVQSATLANYLQSDALSNYRTETQINSLISSSISSFLSSTAINSLIANAGGIHSFSTKVVSLASIGNSSVAVTTPTGYTFLAAIPYRVPANGNKSLTVGWACTETLARLYIYSNPFQIDVSIGFRYIYYK